MNQPSAFQQKYPLSPRKFWKKMLGRVLSTLTLSLMLSTFIQIGISLLLLSNKPSDFDPNIVNETITRFIITTLTLFILILIINAIYISYYIRRYYYDASEQFLTIQKGVFAPTEIHVPYIKIQDIYVDQDVLDRFMGLYDVHIASATVTSGIEAHIDGVDAPVAEALKNLLLGTIQYGATPPQNPSAPAIGPTHSSIGNFQGPKEGMFTSGNYPITDRWIAAALIGNVLKAALYTLFIWVFLLGKRNVIYVLDLPQTLLIYGVIYVILGVWSLLWRATFSFAFLPQFILMKDGVIKREEKHVPYRTLQNVLLQRGLIENLLGLSTVIIENAAMGSLKTGRASRITLPGQPFAKGMELVNELNRILTSSSAAQRAQL